MGLSWEKHWFSQWAMGSSHWGATFGPLTWVQKGPHVGLPTHFCWLFKDQGKYSFYPTKRNRMITMLNSVDHVDVPQCVLIPPIPTARRSISSWRLRRERGFHCSALVLQVGRYAENMMETHGNNPCGFCSKWWNHVMIWLLCVFSATFRNRPAVATLAFCHFGCAPSCIAISWCNMVPCHA